MKKDKLTCVWCTKEVKYPLYLEVGHMDRPYTNGPFCDSGCWQSMDTWYDMRVSPLRNSK